MTVTQSQLAKQLGISQRSVSVAFGGAGRISEKTRKIVLSTAVEMGYRPNRLASSLRKGQSGTVGVVWAFVNPWTGDSYIGMDVLQRLQARGLSTYQAHHGDDRATDQLCRHLDDLISRRVDAIVMQGIPSELMHPEVLALLKDVPTVAVCREDLPDFPGDLVIHDRNQAIIDVVDHLVATGRRRLAMPLASEQESNPPKLAVFQERLRHHGLPPHPYEHIELDYPDSPTNQGESHEMALRRAFPERVDVDAIFAFNDVGAMYIIRDLKQRGLKVPDDVAVVGFNNTEPAQAWDPPIASGDRQFTAVASAVDNFLDQRLSSPDLPPQRLTVPMRFIYRQSAGGRPPRSAT